MNTKQIGLGIAAWFLGILVPVAHHVLLHWPLAAAKTNNTEPQTFFLFRNLPGIDWVYLAAMAIVGLILVVSGMKNRPT